MVSELRVEENIIPYQISNEIRSLTDRQGCKGCFGLGVLSLKLKVK